MNRHADLAKVEADIQKRRDYVGSSDLSSYFYGISSMARRNMQIRTGRPTTENYQYPSSGNKVRQCTVLVAVKKSGELDSIVLQRSTGMPAYDKFIVDAIKACFPYKAPPTSQEKISSSVDIFWNCEDPIPKNVK